MNNFWKNNKTFLAIIIGAIIVGTSVYFGIKDSNNFTQISETPEQPLIIQDIKQASVEEEPALNLCGAEDKTIVTKVIDGDTVVVSGGYHIRLLGIDADEKGYSCYESAKIRLEALVLNKQVILEKDKTDVDQYDRCLRYIFINNINIDVQLVIEGLAVARFYAPDLKYQTEISSAEKQAQQNRAGCKWAVMQ